jgi:DNA-directed RNA polymerase specialized sigma subunit
MKLTIHKVKEVLGDDFANALCKTFPGYQLYIPKKQTALNLKNLDERNKYICNLFLHSGKTYGEIAELMGLSKDRIIKIISNRYKNKN